MKSTGKMLLIILFFQLQSLSWGQRLHGHVKSYTDLYYTIHEDFGRVKKAAILADSILHNLQCFYDVNGNVTQVTEFHSDRTQDCIYEASAGYRDNKIESFHLRFSPELSVEKKPFLIRSANYSYGGMCEMSYKNDINGWPIEEIIFDLAGEVLFKISIKRDSAGNALEENCSDGTIHRNRYDRIGNRIECRTMKPGGNTILTTFRYNDHGDVIEKNVDNFFNSRFKFKYENYTFEYRYDKMGNWIERTDYENLIPQRMLIRTIEYYADM